jgi:hypothetical protein
VCVTLDTVGRHAWNANVRVASIRWVGSVTKRVDIALVEGSVTLTQACVRVSTALSENLASIGRFSFDGIACL